MLSVLVRAFINVILYGKWLSEHDISSQVYGVNLSIKYKYNILSPGQHKSTLPLIDILEMPQTWTIDYH